MRDTYSFIVERRLSQGTSPEAEKMFKFDYDEKLRDAPLWTQYDIHSANSIIIAFAHRIVALRSNAIR